jgi:protein-S-isoprenylcysteine O-methyltransferase Ste14
MKLIIPPPIYGLIIFDAMWWLNSLLPLLAVTFVDQKQLATLAIVTGLTIDVIAIISFIKTKTTINLRSPQNTHQLVTTGLYRFSRKPMYLSLFCLLLGSGIWLGNPLNIFLLLMFLVVITLFQIRLEEKILKKKFGYTYQHYCPQVRSWL